MNRRTLLRGLLALPFVGVAVKHLPVGYSKAWFPWVGVGTVSPYSASDITLIGGVRSWLNGGTYKIAMTYTDTSGRHYYAERTGIPVAAGHYDLMALGGFDPQHAIRVGSLAAISENPAAAANRARFFGGAA